MKTIFKTALLSTLLAFAGQAPAGVIATLTFDSPTGIVGPNDAIPIFLTLTLDAKSDPLKTDATGALDPRSLLTDAAILAAGGDPADVTRTLINVGAECGASFGCNAGPPYDLNFGSMFIGPLNLDLLPGSVTPFLFGTFTPTGGTAAPGTYTFFNAELGFQFSDSANKFFFTPFAQTCPGQNLDCAFTRTVVGGTTVPEPTSLALLGIGAVGLGFTRRKRRV